MLRYGMIQTYVVVLWNNSLRPMGQICVFHWTVIITLDNIHCQPYGVKPFSLSMSTIDTFFNWNYFQSNFNETLNHIQEFSFKKHRHLKFCLYDASDPFHFASIPLRRSCSHSAFSWHQRQFYGNATGQLAWHMRLCRELVCITVKWTRLILIRDCNSVIPIPYHRCMVVFSYYLSLHLGTCNSDT